MKDDDFHLLRGFCDRQTNEQTDICECRVAFATEKSELSERPEIRGTRIQRLISPFRLWLDFKVGVFRRTDRDMLLDNLSFTSIQIGC